MQLALIGSSSSLHSEACKALGGSDGVVHSTISLAAICMRAVAKKIGLPHKMVTLHPCNEKARKGGHTKQKSGPHMHQLGGVATLCHPCGGWLVKFRLLCYVLLTALRACPDQVGTQQGQLSGSWDVLVDDDRGIGSGWQQSKQNYALPAVVGT